MPTWRDTVHQNVSGMLYPEKLLGKDKDNEASCVQWPLNFEVVNYKILQHFQLKKLCLSETGRGLH